MTPKQLLGDFADLALSPTGFTAPLPKGGSNRKTFRSASTIGGAVTVISPACRQAPAPRRKGLPRLLECRQHDQGARAVPGSAVTPTLAVNQRYLLLIGGLKAGQPTCHLIYVMPGRRSSLNLPTASHRLGTLLTTIVPVVSCSRTSCRSCQASRGTHSRGVSPSTSRERFVPFILTTKATHHSVQEPASNASKSNPARE
jgi:hypothetical protein